MVQDHESELARTRLERDGLIRRVGDCHRTTRRWQGAMMRAAFRLMSSGEELEDLRVPIAAAIVELYADELGDAELARMVEAMAPIELRELEPRNIAPPPR